MENDAERTSPGGLHPTPETGEAFGLLRAFEDESLEQSVMEIGRLVREISPQCVALSLTLRESRLTFTLVADSRESALMDAVQYLDGGPCVRAVERAEPVSFDLPSHLPTEEEQWLLFARAGSRLGIATTLSLPVRVETDIVGGVNLYGGTDDAFEGRLEELAAVCSAWASDAVTNADLGFESRVLAAAAPGRLMDNQDVHLATGVVSALQQVDVEEAESRIARAAGRAGVSLPEFARFVLESQSRRAERD